MLAASTLRAGALGQYHALSGFSLFVSCNRNLLTLGCGSVLTAPPTPPSFPALLSFTVTPIYTDVIPPFYLSTFALTWTPAGQLPYAGVLRASAALSPTRGNVRPSDLRIVAALNPLPAAGLNLLDSWISIWGTPPPSGQITFSLNLVDTASGFASSSVLATAPFSCSQQSGSQPGAITIEIEGDIVAVLPNQYIVINGEPVAGS